MSKSENVNRTVASMLATNPTTVEQNLARVWHRHDDLVAVGIPAEMAEHSMLATALVRALGGRRGRDFSVARCCRRI